MLPAIARIIIKQAVFVSFAVVIMGAATEVFAANPVEIAAVTVPKGNICKSTIIQVERATKMPNMLLHTVSLAESGRWNAANRASISWLWTVTAKGKGKFYPNRDKAISAVNRLLPEGVKYRCRLYSDQPDASQSSIPVAGRSIYPGRECPLCRRISKEASKTHGVMGAYRGPLSFRQLAGGRQTLLA